MKQIILFTLLMVNLGAFAQKTYSGKIVNQNNVPLAQATIQSISNLNNAVVSNNKGDFSILLKGDTTVLIKFIGHKSVKHQLLNEVNIITLVETDEILNEVVISASRELQERREVPASISVISAKDIANTKAFGLDQLLNDLPGVVMSTSRAASNEQHFMAVRSPISTKSLFLYLEDGLPIRPTAVFNHNALLELNDVAFQKVEVLKGPASSIYGSEAIGGSFNFLTKNPTRDFTGGLGFQTNDLGLTRYDMELSKYAGEDIGFYLGTQFVQRKDGPVAHSNYEKFALTFKNVNHTNYILKRA